jgi:general secretion pathway protein A
MYEPFFGLKEPAFNLTPDPRFVYFSRHHQEALSAMLYGVENRKGFIQLTGEIGAGKTTLCRTFLKKLTGSVHTSLVLNPRFSEFELLQVIIEDFGIKPMRRKKKDYLDALSQFLLDEVKKGFNAVVIIDEAQLLTPKAMESIRLLSNFETPTTKLIQIVLVGQPELKVLLDRQDLRQVKQRINIRYHLPALSREEAGHYIGHRLSVAGTDKIFFTEQAIDLVHQMSSGVPRVINALADRAMLAAYTQNSKLIVPSMVEYANADMQGIHS